MSARALVEGTEPSVPAQVLELQDVKVLGEGLRFPEGPLVLPDGSIAVVEFRKGVISRCSDDGTVSTLVEVGGRPNGLAIGPDGCLYVCNGGALDPGTGPPAGIQRVDWQAGTVEQLYSDFEGEPLIGPNDLVFDETGMFWFTDFYGNALYYASPDGNRIERPIDEAVSPNGVGLSPDGTTLYWAQTLTRQVMRRRLETPGRLVPSPGYAIRSLIRHGAVDRDALVVGLPGGQELDSLAVEENGWVCVGTLVESGITVVDPESGRVVEKHVLPRELADGAVVNLCFGGDDMCTAYVTLLLTGRLISCRWPRPGLRLPFQP